MSGWTSRPARRWRAWVRLLDRREPGTALALFRIVTGLSLLYALGTVVVADVVDLVWVDLAYGGYRPLQGRWLVRLLGGATPGVVGSLVAITFGAGVLLTAGVLARGAALVAAQGWLALTTLNPDATCAYDPLLGNSLWLLVLADSTATLSLRCRMRDGRWTSERSVTAWPRYLAILQLTVLYFGTGLSKISIHWTPAGGFSALYYILQQPSWQRTDMTWIASVYPLTQIGTAVTWLWELTWPALPLWLWLRRHPDRGGRLRRRFVRLPIRTVYVAVGVTMHVSAGALMVLGPFSAVTLAYYPCLFSAPQLAGALSHVARRRPAPAR